MWCHIPLLLPVMGLVLFSVLPFPVAAPLYAVVAVASWLLYRVTMQALRLRVKTGSEGMAGGLAYVVDPLSPEGVVRYRGELWRAVGDERIERGARVRIERVDGMTVIVRREKTSAGHVSPGRCH